MISDGNGHYIFGTVKVGEKGQIVIPKEARKQFHINPGDTLILVGDDTKGLAIPTDKNAIEGMMRALSLEDK